MKFFGPEGFNPPQERAETPLGESCFYCEEEIKKDDRGFMIPHAGKEEPSDALYHQACLIRTIVGSVGHQRGEKDEDPPGLTKREGAVLALVEFQKNPPLPKVGSLTLKEAQKVIRDEMEGVLDDDYPDNLDRIAVILMDEYGASDAEAEEATNSEWH